MKKLVQANKSLGMAQYIWIYVKLKNHCTLVQTKAMHANAMHANIVHTGSVHVRAVHTVRYHCGGWPEEVNTCFLNSYMVYL